MPCNDVTELIRLRIDDEDRLLGYQLIKKTCGRAVGEQSLLAAELAGSTAAQVLAWTGDAFAEKFPTASDEELVLQLKHLFAVQAGLRTLLGLEPGGVSDPIRVASVAYEAGECSIEAEISVDVLTEQIQACGKCKGCGALAKKMLAAAD